MFADFLSNLCSVCNCIAVIVSLAVLFVAIKALKIAKDQLTENGEAVKTANSLEILSWFDEDYIRETLGGIAEKGQKIKTGEKEKSILDLLYILDTVCTLIKTNKFDKRFLYQMHADFVKIKDDDDVQAVYTNNQAIFTDLDFDYLLKETKDKETNNTKST